MPAAFRTQYLDYAELTAQLTTWAKGHPDFVQLRSLGHSREGRELWLLIIGADPDDGRPAVWIDGNMHASELCGTNAALAIAEDAIALLCGDKPHDLPAHLAEMLRGVLFYVMPRISPDGAEAVLKTVSASSGTSSAASGWIRSSPSSTTTPASTRSTTRPSRSGTRRTTRAGFSSLGNPSTTRSSAPSRSAAWTCASVCRTRPSS